MLRDSEKATRARVRGYDTRTPEDGTVESVASVEDQSREKNDITAERRKPNDGVTCTEER